MKAPYNCERQDEQGTVREDVEKSICEIKLVFVDFLRGCDVCIPIRLNGNGEPDISNGSTDRVARVDADEEPADDAKPFLYKDAAVEEHQRYARERIADGVQNVESVLGLFSKRSGMSAKIYQSHHERFRPSRDDV